MSSRSSNSGSSSNDFHTFTGQVNGAASQKKASFSQASLRRVVTMFDQHGRQWWASVEIRSGMPVGNIEPKEWSAPWLPDQQYLVVNPDDATQLFIDYRRMATDRKSSEDEYHAAALQLAGDKKWPMPALGEYPREITDALGRPPRSRVLVIAAWQRNPWLLGQTETPDPRLEQLVERERPKVTMRPEDWTAEDFGPDSYRASVGDDHTVNRTATAAPKWVASDEPSADDIAQLEQIDGMAVVAANGDVVGVHADTEESDEEFDVDSVPTGELDETVNAALGIDDDDEDLDEEHDAAAVGGKVVHPRHAERVQRQQARRPGQSAKRQKQGAERSAKGAPQTARKRPTLADGAKPVVGR